MMIIECSNAELFCAIAETHKPGIFRNTTESEVERCLLDLRQVSGKISTGEKENRDEGKIDKKG